MPAPIAATATPESEAPAQPTPVVRMPETGRDLALIILALIAVVFALKWAQSLVVSLLLGIVIAGVVCALVFGTYSLRGQMQTIIDQLPQAVSKLSVGLASLREGQANTMQNVQSAANEIEKATSRAPGSSATPGRAATHVVIDTPGTKLGNFLWVGSRGALGVIGQAAMVIFLTFFLLLSADTFKRKLVRVAGPSLSNRKITVRIHDDINDSIQRYMPMLLATKVRVGLPSWIVLRWSGVENAGARGVAGGLLHVAPYFGAAVTAAVHGLAGCRRFAGGRHRQRNFSHPLDGAPDRPLEHRGSVRRAAVPDLAVRRRRHAAERADHRHGPRRGAAGRAVQGGAELRGI